MFISILHLQIKDTALLMLPLPWRLALVALGTIGIAGDEALLESHEVELTFDLCRFGSAISSHPGLNARVTPKYAAECLEDTVHSCIKSKIKKVFRAMFL